MLAKRHQPAHFPPVEAAPNPIIIFVTVCTAKRKPILARPEAVPILQRAWSEANHWLIGRFVVMPDHIHLFCAPAVMNPSPVLDWVTYWKRLVTKRWPRRTEFPLWQRDAWDRQLRRLENYDEKWEYVRRNPVRHKLAEAPDDWPYQGEINHLPW